MDKPTQIRETGAPMNRDIALSIYIQSVPWLRHQIVSGTKCSCGHCHLCAYQFLKADDATLPQEQR